MGQLHVGSGASGDNSSYASRNHNRTADRGAVNIQYLRGARAHADNVFPRMGNGRVSNALPPGTVLIFVKLPDIFRPYLQTVLIGAFVNEGLKRRIKGIGVDPGGKSILPFLREIHRAGRGPFHIKIA